MKDMKYLVPPKDGALASPQMSIWTSLSNLSTCDLLLLEMPPFVVFLHTTFAKNELSFLDEFLDPLQFYFQC